MGEQICIHDGKQVQLSVNDSGDNAIANVADNLINGWFCIYSGLVFDRISILLCH